jgi:O-antigen/teichoic acid export membrane protein
MKNSNLRKLISNYGSRLWSLVSVFIFTPLYIHYLGIESYSIIGFYTLLLGIISFADAGMSSAIIKEFSLEAAANYKYSVLRNVENLYWGLCFFIFLIIFFGSNFIANHWLNSEIISPGDLSYYVSLIGAGVCIQLLSSLYYGSLFGLNEQVQANYIQITWNVFKNGVIIVLFISYRKNLEVYFLWQILCNIIYVVVLRMYTIKLLKKDNPILVNILRKIPKHILTYIGGMFLIAVISSVNSQADKIIASSFFSLKMFGYYNVASLLAQIPVILASPLALFIFPIFTRFHNNENNKLNISLIKIYTILNLLVFSSTFLIALYAKEILMLWTGNTISTKMLPSIVLVVRFLVLGSLFLALQFPLYYLLLSKGKTKYNITQGVVQILIGLPLLYICAKYYGLESIAIPWVIINLSSLLYLSFIVFRYYISLNFRVFFFNYFFMPSIISMFFCILLYLLYINMGVSFFMFFILSGFLSIIFSVFYINRFENRKFTDLKDLCAFPSI